MAHARPEEAPETEYVDTARARLASAGVDHARLVRGVPELWLPKPWDTDLIPYMRPAAGTLAGKNGMRLLHLRAR